LVVGGSGGGVNGGNGGSGADLTGGAGGTSFDSGTNQQFSLTVGNGSVTIVAPAVPSSIAGTQANQPTTDAKAIRSPRSASPTPTPAHRPRR
jgi:hypothetical protein